MSKRDVLSSGLAAMLFLTSLAACSGGAPAPTSASGGNDTAGGAPAGTAGADSGTPGCSIPVGGTLGAALCGMENVRPCSMLNQADVQALFSVPLAATKSDGMGDCTWPLSDPEKGDGLDVSINVGEGDGPLKDDMGTAGLTQISGIGDRASWNLVAGYFPHLGAVKGDDTCEIIIGGGNGQLSVPTTGSGVVAVIDPASLPGFMQKIGALCNQIFAGLGA